MENHNIKSAVENTKWLAQYFCNWRGALNSYISLSMYSVTIFTLNNSRNQLKHMQT